MLTHAEREQPHYSRGHLERQVRLQRRPLGHERPQGIHGNPGTTAARPEAPGKLRLDARFPYGEHMCRNLQYEKVRVRLFKNLVGTRRVVSPPITRIEQGRTPVL